MQEKSASTNVSKASGREGSVRKLVRLSGTAGAHAALVLIGGVWLLPTAGLFFQSLRTPMAISQTGWWTVFRDLGSLTLEPYRRILSSPIIVRSIWNSFAITIPTTILVVAISALAGYAFACMRFRGRDLLFLIVVALLVVPVQVALIPIAQLYNSFGIFGSILGLVLFHVGFGLPFGVFLLRNMYATIPQPLFEAARIDGAGHARIFFTIGLPLVLPAVASLSIFQFVWVWNNLLSALVFTRPESAPITVAIQQQMRNFATNVDIIAPGAFLQLLVPLLVFFAFQQFFVEGITGGSVK